MQDQEIKTTDIYLTAYLLQAKIPAKKIISEGEHRKKVIFVFPGTVQLHECIQKFQENQAIVKVRDYTFFLERVKDLMFASLRSN